MPTLIQDSLQLTDEQSSAVEAVVSRVGTRKMQTVGGFAGTGKSTIIRYLLDEPEFRNFAVCAYTGKAAHVLRRKGMSGACTIHSLIYRPYERCLVCDWVRPPERECQECEGAGCQDCDGTGKHHVEEPKCTTIDEKHAFKTYFSLRQPHEVEVRGFVVDEASMIGRTLHDDLTSFGKPIVYFGDHGQLEPVASDGFNLMERPDITLEQIHRNAGDIAKFAEYIRNGGVARDWRGESDAVDVICGEQLSEGGVDLSKVDQVICAFNKTRVMLNHTFREHLGLPHGVPVAGDRVMCLENNRDLALFNGMQGLIARVQHGPRKYELVLDTDDCGAIGPVPYQYKAFGAEKKPERVRGLIPFDWSYAVTCHKFQGSECPHVLVLEQRCDLWSHQRWAYTAASRAQTKLTWVFAD